MVKGKKNKTSGIKVLNGLKKQKKTSCYQGTEFYFFSCTSWELLILFEALGLPWRYRRTGGEPGMWMTFLNCPRSHIPEPDRCLAFIVNISDSKKGLIPLCRASRSYRSRRDFQRRDKCKMLVVSPPVISALRGHRREPLRRVCREKWSKVTILMSTKWHLRLLRGFGKNESNRRIERGFRNYF